VLQPGRYRIRATLPPATSGQQALSPILEGPSEGVELRGAGTKAIRVVVKAVDAGTKKELEEFSAVAMWSGGQMPIGQGLMHCGAAGAPGGTDRRVTLPPPEAQRSGTVAVVAPGPAPEGVTVALEDADAPKELTVELGPESSVGGKVVGEKGEPLAGVRV